VKRALVVPHGAVNEDAVPKERSMRAEASEGIRALRSSLRERLYEESHRQPLERCVLRGVVHHGCEAGVELVADTSEHAPHLEGAESQGVNEPSEAAPLRRLQSALK
jgi:hypothetical protein